MTTMLLPPQPALRFQPLSANGVGSMLSVDATRFLLGALLIACGRRLFWLFVGVIGFVGGLRFADAFLKNQPDDVVIVFSLIVGLLSAVMAVAVRKVALGAAGFVAGGYLLTQLAVAAGQVHPVALTIGQGGDRLAPWLIFLTGGIAGAVLMNALFTWTLIALSSLSGAALICEHLALSRQGILITFTILASAGILIQSGVLWRRRPAAPQ